MNDNFTVDYFCKNNILQSDFIKVISSFDGNLIRGNVIFCKSIIEKWQKLQKNSLKL